MNASAATAAPARAIPLATQAIVLRMPLATRDILDFFFPSFGRSFTVTRRFGGQDSKKI